LKSGKLKPVKYTVSKRLAIAAVAALPLSLIGVQTSNFMLIVFSVIIGVIIFAKKDWHSWRG
jgi:hypothetical protein|tara:strand:- start:955 stop:1140 length:186 start_codon:yes stop_codon:yes gene_type:complete